MPAAVFHRLRVSLDFANVKTRARTLMVTSAVEQEGKSTTAGNLALAPMCRAGDQKGTALRAAPHVLTGIVLVVSSAVLALLAER